MEEEIWQNRHTHTHTHTHTDIYIKYPTECFLNFKWLLTGFSIRMIVNRARQLCSGTHKVQEQGVGQGTHGDELH
jgi:hypothetical protein